METASETKRSDLIEFAHNRFNPFLMVYDTHLDLNVMRIK